MAKKKENSNYGTGPWMMSKEAFKAFTQVTTTNWPQANVVGRILYVIEPIGHVYQFQGTITIDPCFSKGWWKYPWKPWQTPSSGHFRVFMPQDLDYNEYIASNKGIILPRIETQTLFIKTTDPILTFYKE